MKELRRVLVSISALCACTALPLAAADPTADELLAREPPKYIVEATGKRLNSFISRDIAILARAYAAGHDRKYLEGTVKYMKAAAAYPDWRAKEHYLSASYIVDAFATALELCGPDMRAEERRELEDALVAKGLRPAALHWFWLVGNNWTQVCCAAVSHAALALRERFPEESAACLSNCVMATKSALAAYAPDGCYAEGPSYWRFATEKTQAMVEHLKRHLGDDMGISSMPGFMESYEWIKAMRGPTGSLFNYADGESDRQGAPAWDVKEIRIRVFRGAQPSAVIAGKSFFLAAKGGKAEQNHAHMDAGSFVFETISGGRAVRWVEDLGTERYRRIERAKIDIWDFSQSSSRWSVFRHGPFSHSTFTIDGELHRVKGFVPLRAVPSALGPDAIVADCSHLYDGVWVSAVRIWRVDRDASYDWSDPAVLVLRDSFTGVKKNHVYEFGFCTFADAKIENGAVVLEKDGCRLDVRARTAGTWNIEDVSKPKRPFEAPNPKAKRVSFRRTLPEGDSWVEFTFRPVRHLDGIAY